MVEQSSSPGQAAKDAAANGGMLRQGQAEEGKGREGGVDGDEVDAAVRREVNEGWLDEAALLLGGKGGGTRV